MRGADGLAGPASCAPRCWGCLRVSSRWELKGEHFNVTLFVRFGAFVEMGVIITGGNQLGIVKLFVCMCVLQPTVAAESSAWAGGRNPGLLLQLRLSWARVYFGSSTFLGDL